LPTVSSNSSTFTPLHPFNLEDPKTWAETIGMHTILSPEAVPAVLMALSCTGKMDWDETHICFTKRSLLDFLK
jgi:hypothetical protein